MREDLDKLLCERYPAIFVERHADDSAMHRGFSCGDGWFTLIDTLCERLQFSGDRGKAPQVIAIQVKEKMGRLRFHVREADDWQRGLIAMAEAAKPAVRFPRN